MKKKCLPLGTLALVLTALGGLVALGLAVPWAFSSGSASATRSSLTCSVRTTSCNVGEVEVFQISATSNAHAAVAGSGYDNLVCCDGVAGLGTNCSGTYDTVLTLSAADNAHVGSLGQYPTEVCLSADTVEVVDCMFAPSCSGGQACLATASGTDNAHVADCDGLDDYATKVCCYAGATVPVGGIAQLPHAPASSSPNYPLLAALAAVGLLALITAAWYARRRWQG